MVSAKVDNVWVEGCRFHCWMTEFDQSLQGNMVRAMVEMANGKVAMVNYWDVIFVEEFV